MPIGPTLILDKSTLQSLQIEEARWIGHHFHVNLIEPLYVEIIGASTATDRRNPIGDIVSLSKKLLEMVPGIAPNARHRELILGELFGHLNLQLDGRIILEDVQTVRLPNGRLAQFQPEPPHFEALRRLARGKLSERELKGASSLRDFIANVDLNRIKEVMQEVPGLKLGNLVEVLALVDRLFAQLKPFEVLKKILDDLHVTQEHHDVVLKRWRAMSAPPVSEFVPYSHFIWRFDRFFDLSIGVGLISTKDSKTYIDAMYLYYLPFCEIFVSGDKFHREVVPLFLRPDQRYCWGPDLKADAAKLRAYYENLPDEIRRRGSMTYARLPPKDDAFMVASLFDELRPGWRDW